MPDELGLDLSGSDSGGGASFGGGYSLGGKDFNFNLDPLSLPTAPESLGGSGGGFKDFAAGLMGGGDKGSSGGILGGLGSFAKGVALPAAQLGIAGLGIKSSLDAAGNAKRQAGQLAQGQQIQRESAQPLQQFGTQTLQHAQAGQIDPAVQAMIDQWTQGEKVKMQQFFAHNGISDSTMMQSALADIDAKAVAMRAGVLGQDKDQAIRALTFAMGGGNQIAQTASREQNELDNLIAASNKALAALTGAAG